MADRGYRPEEDSSQTTSAPSERESETEQERDRAREREWERERKRERDNLTLFIVYTNQACQAINKHNLINSKH